MTEALITLWSGLPLFLQLGLKIGAIILPLLGMVAYYTLAERKVIAYMHVRVGPNRVGPKGLLQPIERPLSIAQSYGGELIMCQLVFLMGGEVSDPRRCDSSSV